MNKIYFALVLLFYFQSSHAQTCGFMSSSQYLDFEINGNFSQEENIRTKIYLVRDANGGGGATLELVEEIFSNAKLDMAQYNINLTNDCFAEFSVEVINNQELYDVVDTDELCKFKDYCQSDALNIFFLDPPVDLNSSMFAGLASTPGNICLIRAEDSNSYKTLVHELGHCFGLWHTSHGRPYEFKVNGQDWECDNNNGVTSNTIPVPTCIESSYDAIFFNKTIEFELVDGSNSSTSGDFVTDTPADISITNANCDGGTEAGILSTCDNSIVSCGALDNKRKKDPNCDKYNPDWTNYMRVQTNKTCDLHFSPNQILRMKGVINDFLSFLRVNLPPDVSTIDCSIPTIDLNTLHNGTIPYNANLIWSTDDDPSDGVDPILDSTTSTGGIYYAYYHFFDEECYGPASIPVSYTPEDAVYSCNACTPVDVILNNGEILGGGSISGNLIINSGTVTINQKVEFSKDSKVIIKSGAKLIIEGNGLLTKCPDANQWQGVHLEGPSETNQLSLLPGRIEMKNGATIEHAVTGIDTRNNFTVSNYTVERGGGIVRMDSGSKIDNCEIGIYFASLSGKGIPFNSPYAEEQSVINNSFISNCDVGIYITNNNGLEVNGTVFTDNYPDVESHISSFDFTGNTFQYGIEMFAEYPNFQGANIISNNFVNNYGDGSVLFMESQGNAEPIIFDKNSTFGFGMRIFGDAHFFARNNDFYARNNDVNDEPGTGIKAWESGDDQFNMVVDNAFFGKKYGSSVNGVNDIEYLTNCFEETKIYDIEVNNNASIHEAQGDPELQISAGNCFEARIGTSSGSEHFDYWTKDGYTFVPHECKYPGDGNFTRQEAESEAEGAGCGTFGNYTGTLPRSYRDCRCGPDPAGCIDMVNGLLAEIDRLENDSTVNPWIKRWLIAKYKRCINSVQKSFVKLLLDDGRTEDAINHLSVLPSFRLRIMAYALMMNAHEIDRARTYLNSLNTDGEGEQAFVNAQNIYLDYLLDRTDYKLDISDRNYLLSVGTDKNPYSGYVRSIYYKLTGERIDIDFEHLNGKSSTRAVANNAESRLNVFPNPLNEDFFNVSIDEFSADLEYTIKISSLDGRILENTVISDVSSRIAINGNKGIYIVQLFENNKLVSTQKLVKL